MFDLFKDERIVGELQYYLIEKYNLFNFLFPIEESDNQSHHEEYSNAKRYLRYVKNIDKPDDEASLLNNAIERLNETNKEFNIDIEKIINECLT
jgi:hypothetical protein